MEEVFLPRLLSTALPGPTSTKRYFAIMMSITKLKLRVKRNNETGFIVFGKMEFLVWGF